VKRGTFFRSSPGAALAKCLFSLLSPGGGGSARSLRATSHNLEATTAGGVRELRSLVRDPRAAALIVLAASVRDVNRSARKRPTPGLSGYTSRPTLSRACAMGWRSIETRAAPFASRGSSTEIFAMTSPGRQSPSSPAVVVLHPAGTNCRSSACVVTPRNFIAGDYDAWRRVLARTTANRCGRRCPQSRRPLLISANHESRKIARPRNDWVAFRPLRAGRPIVTAYWNHASARAAFATSWRDRRTVERPAFPTDSARRTGSTMNTLTFPAPARLHPLMTGNVSGPAESPRVLHTEVAERSPASAAITGGTTGIGPSASWRSSPLRRAASSLRRNRAARLGLEYMRAAGRRTRGY